MADDKAKGKSSGDRNADAFEELVAIIFTLLVLGAIVTRITTFFGSNPSYSKVFSWGAFYDYFALHFLPTLTFISYILSAIFIFGIVWVVDNLTKLNKSINEYYNKDVEYVVGTKEKVEADKNHKWERILSHLNSSNPNDWKFAILEADIMLGDLLDVLQYRGETIADKLKNVEPSDFNTIESAWEAHKVRNAIAHEGADFVITDREARRVIDLYKSIFQEFSII